MTSVVLADDQEMIRVGLRVMLETRGIEVLAEAANGREAVARVRAHQPDVVLMDVRMPVLDGIGATEAVVAAGTATRVLVVTTYDLDDLVYRALRAGAAGFMLKSLPADRIVEGVRLVAAGEALLAPTVTRRLVERYVTTPRLDADPAIARLTEREREVLRLVAHGLSNAEICHELVVSLPTVKTHVNRVFAKLGIESRAQAVVRAYECGLVVPGRNGLGDRRVHRA